METINIKDTAAYTGILCMYTSVRHLQIYRKILLMLQECITVESHSINLALAVAKVGMVW